MAQKIDVPTSEEAIAQPAMPRGVEHPAPAMAWHGKTFDEHVSLRWRGQGWLSLHLPPLPWQRCSAH